MSFCMYKFMTMSVYSLSLIEISLNAFLFINRRFSVKIIDWILDCIFVGGFTSLTFFYRFSCFSNYLYLSFLNCFYSLHFETNKMYLSFEIENHFQYLLNFIKKIFFYSIAYNYFWWVVKQVYSEFINLKNFVN